MTRRFAKSKPVTYALICPPGKLLTSARGSLSVDVVAMKEWAFTVPLMGAGVVALTVFSSVMMISFAVPGMTVMIGADRDCPQSSAAAASAISCEKPRIVKKEMIEEIRC